MSFELDVAYLSTKSNLTSAKVNSGSCLFSVLKSYNILPSKRVVRAGFGCLGLLLFDLRPVSFLATVDG